MSGRRETIHLSLGPTANAVSSHLLNLEGLAATAASPDDSLPVCEPVVTHRRDDANQVWVPRVLLVDESRNLQSKHLNHRPAESTLNNKNNKDITNETAAISSWGGTVQEFNVQNFSLDDFQNVDKVVANLSYNSNPSVESENAAPWLGSWYQTATDLAYAPYSQYRLPQMDPAVSLGARPQSDSNARHFNWDDLGDEPEEEEHERAQRQEQQRRLQERKWEEERSRYEDALSNIWNSSEQVKEASEKGQDAKGPSETDLKGLKWVDFLMPPHSPLSECTYGLPSTSSASSLEAPPLHSFNVTNDRAFVKAVLEEVWEKVRIELERTDSCQGFTILTEGCGIYAGISDWLLEEVKDECRAAGRWVFHVAGSNDSSSSGGNDENVAQKQSTELSRAQAKVRDSVQRGLAMASLSGHAHVTIPLKLPGGKEQSLFRSSAKLAMALETALLPVRARPSSRASLLGWNSMSGYEEGAHPTGMSLADFLSSMQPSPRYSLLELDAVLSEDNQKRVTQGLAMGTSVERDPRLRRPPNSIGSGHPGEWLLDAEFAPSSSTPSPGILTCLSPGHVAKQDRSLHYHYGLATCLRRGQLADNPWLTDNQQYLTCAMEGMGIRYRPETAFGLVTNQSLTRLTSAGHRYGAGSYWEYLLGPGTSMPVVSVLGNTTRMYPHLHTVAQELNTAIKSSKTKGYYQREVANGNLPELDDCEEALEQCLDLRDVYEPPNGSGLEMNEEEHYFE